MTIQVYFYIKYIYLDYSGFRNVKLQTTLIFITGNTLWKLDHNNMYRYFLI